MEGERLLLELIKITDMKIDLMEYVIEKLDGLSKSDEKEFIQKSSTFDKIDWLNMEFVDNYQRFLKYEGIRDISQIRAERYETLRDLKHLVSYALELETGLDEILKHIYV